MTASETTASGSVLWAEPQLFVTDIARACTFYVEKLGFRIVFQHGEPLFYAQVARGGARLNLRHADRPAFDATFRAQEGDVLSATVTVDQAEPLFLELQQRGATFHQMLRTESWGARTFIVRDPDGNLIAFAGD
ncbi:MAG: VOC family protein [Alphaproteobacteria bacterium]|nr:VOC family protein [Alphaproteobacteria bacterium]